MIDTTINLGHLITIASFVLGGIGFVWAVKLDTAVVKTRLDFQDNQLGALTKELQKVGEILISLAQANGRMDRIEDRQLAQSKRFDEMIERQRKAG